MGSRNTALAKTEPSAFPIMARSVSEITKTFLDNLGGEALTARDLERILVPQGKGTQWEVVGLDGVVESLPTLEGVVIHWRPKRARRSEEHTSELQSQSNLVCRLLLEKKK